MTKKNVVFLFADDLKYSTIHAINNQDIITPNLDALCKNGTTFTNAHIPGGSWAAVCQPSRAMVNTGRSLFHLEGLGANIPEEHALLGETMQMNGYNSFGTGKWHNCTRSYARSFNCGAEVFFGGMYDHWKVPLYSFDKTGQYPNRHIDVFSPGYDNIEQIRIYDHHRGGTHSTDLFADTACDFIRSYEDEKPFYIYCAFMAPHDPRTMPHKYKDMYDVDKISLPENFLPEHPFDFGIKDVRDERLLPQPRDPRRVKSEIRDYYAMITHVDDAVGKVIQALKDTGKYEDTIIIFSADNGLAVGEHGLLGKQSNYDHSIRVPFIISGPGIPKNEIRDQFIYLYDIFPTVCELTGAAVPESVEGISFAKTITDNQQQTRDHIFAVFGDKVRSYKTKKWKLIEYKCGDLRRTQLFDLEADPYEMHDLFWTAEVQPIVKELREKLYQDAVAWGDLDTNIGQTFWCEYRTAKPEEWSL